MNALTVAMATELEADGIRVNAVTPGSTKTKMNPGGTESVEEGAAEAVRLATLTTGGTSGTFTHATYGALPW